MVNYGVSRSLRASRSPMTSSRAVERGVHPSLKRGARVSASKRKKKRDKKLKKRERQKKRKKKEEKKREKKEKKEGTRITIFQILILPLVYK